MSQAKLRLFCSYAHEDRKFLDALLEHLSPLRHIGLIEPWSDDAIRAGEDWAESISGALEVADIVLLLVSSSFLASEYCYKIEMDRAIELHEEGQAVTIPIIVRACDWKVAPFSKLNALPVGARPVSSWSNQDEAWADVAVGIREKVEALRKERQAIEMQQPDSAEIEETLQAAAISLAPEQGAKKGLAADQDEARKGLAEDDELLVRFLSSWPRWWFNPSRIERWGAERKGFERLAGLGARSIHDILDDLEHKGLVKSRPSQRTGGVLYKLNSGASSPPPLRFPPKPS